MYTDVIEADCVTKCAMPVLSRKDLKFMVMRQSTFTTKVIQLTVGVRKVQQVTLS